mgnify:CR=1 FL=1
MVDKLEDWDIRWNEPSPQMHTLRELNITLLQLHVLGKITAVEMGNLLRMVHSVDPENHVVAHETVKELLKTIT